MNRFSIVDIANVIDQAMREYIRNHPDDKIRGYDNTIKSGVAAAMKFEKGIYNPATIAALCQLNRNVFDDAGYMIQC